MTTTTVKLDPFKETEWTAVQTASDPSDPRCREALSRLCRDYMRPIYILIRRKVRSQHDAEDLLQGFFGMLLARNWIREADRDRGKFRQFLQVKLKGFASNLNKARQADKRGGKVKYVSLDTGPAEALYQSLPANSESPDRLFDRQWAMTVLEKAFRSMQETYRKVGKEERFKVMKEYLIREDDQSQAGAAEKLGMSYGAFRTELSRMRGFFSDLVRAEVARTVNYPGDIDEEMRYLREILG